METRAPIQSDSDTLRDGIENESFDRNTTNAENVSEHNQSANEQNPAHNETEHLSERDSEDERDEILNSQTASDSTSTYSNDPKTTIEVTTINIPIQDIDVNQSQSQSETENVSSV